MVEGENSFGSSRLPKEFTSSNDVDEKKRRAKFEDGLQRLIGKEKPVLNAWIADAILGKKK